MATSGARSNRFGGCRRDRTSGRNRLGAGGGRCNGSWGYQVWEHRERSGRTVIFCANVPNLADETWNLGWFETWNNRISSFETFNMGASRRTCFWFNAGYGPGSSYGVTGNAEVR